MRMHQYARVLVGVLLAAAPFGCSTSKPAVQTGLKVTHIDVGRSVTAEKTIAEKTDSFRPADTFYLSVETDGSGPTAILTARGTYQEQHGDHGADTCRGHQKSGRRTRRGNEKSRDRGGDHPAAAERHRDQRHGGAQQRPRQQAREERRARRLVDGGRQSQ